MSLLNLSGGTLTLAKSLLFSRLLLVIYAFAWYIICLSAFYVTVKMVLLAGLSCQLYRLLTDQTRALVYQRLVLQKDEWFLHHKNGITGPYKKHRVTIEAGIFFILQLSSDSKRKTFVIFFDQLQKDEYRCLRILEKMR